MECVVVIHVMTSRCGESIDLPTEFGLTSIFSSMQWFFGVPDSLLNDVL